MYTPFILNCIRPYALSIGKGTITKNSPCYLAKHLPMLMETRLCYQNPWLGGCGGLRKYTYWNLEVALKLENDHAYLGPPGGY